MNQHPPIWREGQSRQRLTLCFRSLVIGALLGGGLSILATLAGLYWA